MPPGRWVYMEATMSRCRRPMRIARKKRILCALGGGYIGVAIGFLVGFPIGFGWGGLSVAAAFLLIGVGLYVTGRRLTCPNRKSWRRI